MMKQSIITLITAVLLLAVGGGLIAIADGPTAMPDGTIQISACDQGPTNPATSKTTDLDEDASDWGVYCEGTPTWVLTNVPAPALDGKSLRCSITGGDSHSNIHCYRNLLSEPIATEFILTMPFYFTPTTTCNNQGGDSVVQAIEFSMSKWHLSQRYEFALQWENVAETPGDGAPQWRYWDPHQTNRWVPLNPPITQCLQAGKWYTFTLSGKIVDEQVHYQQFGITPNVYPLNLPPMQPVTDSTITNNLAVAIQLDGNGSLSPYDVFVDNVSLVRRPPAQLFLPLILK